MVCQESECMSNIELDITPGRKMEINNSKSKYPYKRRNHCIEQFDIYLYSRPARVTKANLDAIINALKNKQTFTIHSRPAVKRNITAFKYKKLF